VQPDVPNGKGICLHCLRISVREYVVLGRENRKNDQANCSRAQETTETNPYFGNGRRSVPWRAVSPLSPIASASKATGESFRAAPPLGAPGDANETRRLWPRANGSRWMARAARASSPGHPLHHKGPLRRRRQRVSPVYRKRLRQLLAEAVPGVGGLRVEPEW
jgi:hypothetical protein